MSPLDNVRLLEFPGVEDPARGILTVIERLHFDSVGTDGISRSHPFDIKRVFYIHDIPKGCRRGGHAHTSNREVLVCLSGGVNLILTDGHRDLSHSLNNKSGAIVIPEDVWMDMYDFKAGTILLVLCSEEYREEGYIHDFDDFCEYIDNKYSL